MTRVDFGQLLKNTAAAAVGFARELVENELPSMVRFRVLLNQSCDVEVRDDERVYPGDDDREYCEVMEDEVVELLWRDGMCPEWIDVSVETATSCRTLVRLSCRGRFTSNQALLHYANRGMGPFGIKSPELPLGYRAGVKFRLPEA